MKKINVMVSKVIDGGMVSNTKEVVEDYTDYYKYGGFELFDMVRIQFAGEELTLVVDDEGMLKSGNYGREVVGYPEPLFGNFILTGGVDSKGATLPFPSEISLMQVNNMISEVLYVTK